MSVTPAYRLSLPIENCAVLLSNSATFQTLMGAASAAAAKAKIYWYETDDEHVSGQATWPRAIISYVQGSTQTLRESTTGFVGTGPIEIRIEATTAQTTIQDGVKDWLNKIGAIIEEIQALVIAGGYLNVNKIVVDQIGRMDQARNNGNDNYGVVMMIEWLGMNT